MQRSFYPAKLLLFGEYIIIRGAAALAVPFSHFGGRWERTEDRQVRLNRQYPLEDFGIYLKENAVRFPLLADFNHTDYQQALSEGWYFDSDIPTGYGLGSSGALCAAIYDRFFNNAIAGATNEERQQLKQLFSQMESFFHGSSSGIDPLVCYLQKGILIQQEQLKIVESPDLTGLHFFLLNTGQSRSTEPLVKGFLDNCQNKHYVEQLDEQLLPANEQAIQAWLNGLEQNLWEAFRQISTLEAMHFSAMIPAYLQADWEKGISGTDFSLKLCGAGGGGFMLGITRDRKKCEEVLAKWPLLFV